MRTRIFLVLTLFVATSISAQLVNQSFSNFERFMTGDPTYNGAGWDNTNGTNFRMSPAGDGTYIITNLIIPGQIWVYRFTCRSNASQSVIWEDLWGTEDITNFQNRRPDLQFGIINVGGYNFRKITLPTNAQDYFTITNNFGENPKPPDDFLAVPIATNAIRLSWKYNTLGKQIDVRCGGTNEVYRSTNASGPFTKIASLSGYITSYTNTGLTKGKTYYYYICSYDAYRGYLRLASTYYDLRSATPRDKVKVIFKVENIDIEKVLTSKERIVWATPIWADGRFYPYKIPGSFAVGTTLKE